MGSLGWDSLISLDQKWETGAIVIDSKSPRDLEVLGTIKWGQSVYRDSTGSLVKRLWAWNGDQDETPQSTLITNPNSGNFIGNSTPPGNPGGNAQC